MKKVIFAGISAALLSGSVFADNLKMSNFPLTSSPAGGYHVVKINGVQCKLKSSNIVNDAYQGCNYILDGAGATFSVRTEQANGCSSRCE
jgi:hypothetical protein